MFAYTKRQQVMSDDNCLDAAAAEGPVKLVRYTPPDPDFGSGFSFVPYADPDSRIIKRSSKTDKCFESLRIRRGACSLLWAGRFSYSLKCLHGGPNVIFSSSKKLYRN